ncbi:MAG: SRPBCC family protein [Acidimicrobiales bacterium]
MATIAISQRFPVTPEVLWHELRQIDRHVLWMHDAVAITFSGEQRESVGTQFLCVTKVGPFVTRDEMSITQWRTNHVMGVEHRGLIAGSGTFELEPYGTDCELTWRESLRFPWWLAGPLGSLAAAPVLRVIWRRNLRTLAAIIAKDPPRD